LILLLLNGCSEKTSQEEELLRPVRYQTVVAVSDGQQPRIFPGVAQPGLESVLSFKVAGTIREIPVDVGDAVQKGQMIATLDGTDYQLQLQQVQAQLDQLQAKAANVKAEYDRIQDLYAEKVVSQSQLDEAQAAYESTMASIRALQQQVDLAQTQLSYTEISAPFDGTVAAVNVEIKENVQPGYPIVTLEGQAPPEVAVDIPETVISSIQAGDEVSVRFEAIAEKTFPGIITEVGVATSRRATTYPVTITLQEQTSQIHPGMVADVVFPVNSPSTPGAFLVPSQAVMEDDQGRFVYRLQPAEDETAVTERVNVQVGQYTDRGIEITEGLQEGDLIVTAGVSRIEDQMKVRLLDTKE
jgi:RND family efflux transporter MFP subunit